jgi:hypothetical protein
MKPLLLASAFLALMATACSDRVTTSTEMVFDEQKPPPADQVTFTFIQQNVFDLSCALSGCHADLEYPNLSADQAYANIVDAPSSEGLDLVTPGDPDNSYLYIKIAGGPRLNGSLMPRGRAPLPAETIAAVREWIERGAPND